MKSFEDFKTSRERMDPSTKKMNDRQWEKAYAAYCSSRERVRKTRASAAHRRSSGGAESNTGYDAGSPTHGGTAALRDRVRQQSAYADVRMIVNILVWVMMGATVILAVLQMATYTSPVAASAALLGAAIRILGLLIIKLILNVIIDIPDTALYLARKETAGS